PYTYTITSPYTITTTTSIVISQLITVVQTSTLTDVKPTTVISTVYEAPNWVIPILVVLGVIIIGFIAMCMFRCRKP
ncbi:MAG: hypothetical protein QXW20_04560, partial [Ignisphaera sp.]